MIFRKSKINKETAYILGYLWADGFLTNKVKGKYYSVGLRISENDMSDIKCLFSKILLCKSIKFYSYKNPINKPTWKKMEDVRFQDVNFTQDLINKDFLNKNLRGSDKILKIIPNKFHNYFWRGYFDGDGCFYVTSKRQCFSISSEFNHKWDLLSSICNKKDIKFFIKKNKYGNSSSSTFIVNRIEDIIKFGDFIYDGVKTIGLKRKYLKFLQIKNKLNNSSKFSRFNTNLKGKFLKSPNGRIIEIINLSNFSQKYGLSKTGISFLLTKRALQWNGWTLPQTTKQDIKRQKEIFSQKISKTYYLMKNGLKIEIKNLLKYCRNNKLGHSSMKKLVSGKISSYKSYTKI